jgi:hypothetical protein
MKKFKLVKLTTDYGIEFVEEGVKKIRHGIRDRKTMKEALASFACTLEDVDFAGFSLPGIEEVRTGTDEESETLENSTVGELKLRAKELGISDYYTMRKAELIEAIQKIEEKQEEEEE